MNELIDWGVIIQLAALVCGGVGVYAYVKSDQAVLRERERALAERVTRLENAVYGSGKQS